MSHDMNPAVAAIAACGPLGALIAGLDYAASPLGPVAAWSASLTRTVQLILPARAEIVLFWGPDYVALYNEAYAPTIGNKHPSVLGRPASEGWRELWDDLGPLLASVRETGETVFAKDRPFYIERSEGGGEEVFFDISYSAVREDDGTVGGVLCIVSETTERVRAQRQSLTERNRLWTLSRDPFLVADARGVWLSVSPAWTEILGWSEQELVGRTSVWMEHPDDRDKTRAELDHLAAGGEPTQRFENRFRAKDGTYRWFSWTATPHDGMIYCVARDTTDEKVAAVALRDAEAALRQSQKMETVGQLTGGVAHDFNNLLQIVTGNLEILIRNLPDSLRLKRAADNAMKGARRAAALTQRLLAFARRQPLDPRRIDPNRLVAGMSDLLHRTLGETVAVETVQGAGVWTLEVDVNQLENAILNLAVNARDAMTDGGKLTIETTNAYLDTDYAARHAEVAAGQYVLISVSDTGLGMDAATVERAFEPFFTTKEVGRGTGLGLSMVYGFIRQSRGHVKIYSEPGEGTTVKLYLPRHRGRPAADEAPPASPEPVTEQHGEIVLVCEDDDDVRAYSVESLRDLGYRVLEAHDGASALRVLQQLDCPIDLLFTDVVLPGGMTGAVLAQHAHALRPSLKVLFTTGYARNAIIHQGRLDAGVQLLTKPFTYAELARRVRDLLGD